LGITNKWIYDALGRVVNHTDGNGNVYTKGFDGSDNNTNIAAANGAGSARYFKNQNILEIEENSDFGRKDYYHDLDDNNTSIKHLERNCDFGTMDAIGRSPSTHCEAGYSSGSTTTLNQNDIYSYDQSAYGNLDSVTSQTANGVNTTYHYDGLHRVTGKTQHNLTPQLWGYPSSTLNVGYSYTYGSRVSAITYPSGNTVSISYNSNGQLNSISYGGQSIIQRVGYDFVIA
jgi:YD repeat-containing protein